MPQVVIDGEAVAVGDLPKSVMRLGFNSRMEIMTAANKFGTIEHPMKLSDVVEFFKLGKEKENKQ